MKYSEAIRLGSMLYPQCVSGALIEQVPRAAYLVCANGAAALALGVPVETLLEEGTVIAPGDIWNARPMQSIQCPACEAEWIVEALELLTHLNDYHEWTRERIADWLAASGHDFEIDLAKPECAPAAEPVAAGVAE